jgi:hypothetical protein
MQCRRVAVIVGGTCALAMLTPASQAKDALPQKAAQSAPIDQHPTPGPAVDGATDSKTTAPAKQGQVNKPPPDSLLPLQEPAVAEAKHGSNREPSLLAFLAKNGGIQAGGTILGALIAFGGLVWGASRGFSNVIRAQEDAENRRKRERQEQTRFDTQTLALGLLGEVTAIKSKCEIHKSVLRSLRDDWQPDTPEWDKHAHDAITISPHPAVSATMYQSNANRLGLLGIPTVQHVSELYSRLIPHEKSATAPDDKIFVRHFVGVVNQWIENLGYTLEYIDTVLTELAVIGATGDPNTIEQLTKIGRQSLAEANDHTVPGSSA